MLEAATFAVVSSFVLLLEITFPFIVYCLGNSVANGIGGSLSFQSIWL